MLFTSTPTKITHISSWPNVTFLTHCSCLRNFQWAEKAADSMKSKMVYAQLNTDSILQEILAFLCLLTNCNFTQSSTVDSLIYFETKFSSLFSFTNNKTNLLNGELHLFDCKNDIQIKSEDWWTFSNNVIDLSEDSAIKTQKAVKIPAECQKWLEFSNLRLRFSWIFIIRWEAATRKFFTGKLKTQLMNLLLKMTLMSHQQLRTHQKNHHQAKTGKETTRWSLTVKMVRSVISIKLGVHQQHEVRSRDRSL